MEHGASGGLGLEKSNHAVSCNSSQGTCGDVPLGAVSLQEVLEFTTPEQA